MGEHSYKLALPLNLHVHDVFHASLLKKYVLKPGHILDLDDNVLVNQEEFRDGTRENFEDQGEATA